MSSGVESFTDHRLSRYEQAIEGELIDEPLLPRPVQHAVTYATAKQLGRGAVGRVRVTTAHQVAHMALEDLDDLEAQETAAAARDPINGAHRHRRVVDAFTAVAVDAVLATGRGSAC